MGKEYLEKAADLIADGGDLNEARRLIIQYIKTKADDAEAWALMAQVTDDPVKKKDCLERSLSFAADDYTRQWAQDELAALEAPARAKPEEPVEAADEFFTRPVEVEEETAYADGQVPDILSALGYPPPDTEPAQPDAEFSSADLEATFDTVPAFGSDEGDLAATPSRGGTTPLDMDTMPAGGSVTSPLDMGDDDMGALSMITAPLSLNDEETVAAKEEVLEWLTQKEPEEPVVEVAALELPDFLSEREQRQKEEDEELLDLFGLDDEDEQVDEEDLFASLGISGDAPGGEDLLGEFASEESMTMDDVDDLFRQVDDLIDKNPTPPSGLDDTGVFALDPPARAKEPTLEPAASVVNVAESLRQAVKLGKEGKKAEAGKIVSQVLEIDAENPDAWAIMSQLVDDPELEAQCLRNVIDLSDQPRVREWAALRLEKVGQKKGKKGKAAVRKAKQRRKGRISFLGWILLLLVFLALLIGGMALFAPEFLPFELPWLTGEVEEQVAEAPAPTMTATTPAPTATAAPTTTPAPTPTPKPEFGAGVTMLLEEGGYALASAPDGAAIAAAGEAVLLYRDGVISRLSEESVRSVAFSADGLALAAGTQAGDVLLFDVEAKSLSQTLAVGETPLSLAFEPDGTRLLVGTDHGSIVVFDGATGEKLYTIAPEASAIRSLAWAPSGAYFAAGVGTGGLEGRVILFDEATGAQIKALPLESEVTSVDINVSGSLLAFATQNGRLGLWEVLKEGQNPATITLVEPAEISDALLESFPEGWDFMVDDVSFAPDGTLAVGTSDGMVALWDTAAFAEIRRLDTQASIVNSTAWADGSEVLYTLTDSTFIRWVLAEVTDEPAAVSVPDAIVADTLAITEKTAMEAANDPIVSVAYNAAGDQIVVADADNALFFYDVAEDAINLNRLANGPITGASITTLNMASDMEVSVQGGVVTLWNEDETLATFTSDFPILAFGVSSDGDMLAGGGLNRIAIWNTEDGSGVTGAEWESFGEFTTISWLPESNIVAAGTATGIVAMFDIEVPDPTILPEVPVGAPYSVDALAFANPLSLVVAISDSAGRGYLAFYSVLTESYTTIYRISDSPVAALALTPDGALLATGTMDGEITFWDTALAAGIGRVNAPRDGDLSTLSFSPDGSTLIAGYQSSDLAIWSLVE